MTLNLLEACAAEKVRCFFYASSACVYPGSLQGDINADVALKESDVFAHLPPDPQGLYGLEKLVTEFVLHHVPVRMDLHIARFHNIYGPGGSWFGGREKAPAAFLRKAIAAFHLGSSSVEMWGDGTQRRSFCYIDDAVEGIIRLLKSGYHHPINIGSSHSCTMRDLAHIALRCAGLDSSKVSIDCKLDRPTGVSSRNSNNDLVTHVLGWAPQTSLEDGMRLTHGWLRNEVDAHVSTTNDLNKTRVLTGFLTSAMVDLQSDGITFAILLPITSRGSSSPQCCLDNLSRFGQSLSRSTKDDRQRLGERYHIRIYLAIDGDDDFLREGGDGHRAEAILQTNGFLRVKTLVCNYPRGHVCALWSDLARQAWQDQCDYFVLMGDDIELLDENWMSVCHHAFGDLASREGIPHGLGCVAFTDTTFPGMPTFPVVHRTHMDIFNGQVIPDTFINQDGDPFLFQLYRRWGCSFMMAPRLQNHLGGSFEARYHKISATGWTFDTLDNATSAVESWLRSRKHFVNFERKLTIDLVIPSYRVQMKYLRRMLSLQPSPTCTVMYIVIVDNPNSPEIHNLMTTYGHRPDVRIRVNKTNLGASASRNRGLSESSAEWVFFLDDDVTPDDNILKEAERIIRAYPDAAGFVGNVEFPPSDTVFTAAVHLAGVTYFWDIAQKRKDDHDLPWGVTASLIARRNVRDDVVFDVRFPKTGGGEDIDFCRKKRQFSIDNHRGGFHPAPDVKAVHPWWNDGRRTYWRFYMWSKGDGMLVKLYDPQLTYRDYTTNAAETLVCSALVFMVGLVGCNIWLSLLGLRMAVATLLANVIHDLYRHLWRDAHRAKSIKTTVHGLLWVLAILESTLIRVFSEYGRIVGLVERGEIAYMMVRFDWFTGRAGAGPRNEERLNNAQRLFLSVLILSILLKNF